MGAGAQPSIGSSGGRGGQATPPGHSPEALARAPDLSNYRTPEMGRVFSSLNQPPNAPPPTNAPPPVMSYSGGMPGAPPPASYSGGRPTPTPTRLAQLPQDSRFGAFNGLGGSSHFGAGQGLQGLGDWRERLGNYTNGLRTRGGGGGNWGWLSQLRNRRGHNPSQAFSPQGGGDTRFRPQGANPITSAGSVAGTQQSPTNATQSGVTAPSSATGAQESSTNAPPPGRPSSPVAQSGRPRGLGGANSQAIIQALRNRYG